MPRHRRTDRAGTGTASEVFARANLLAAEGRDAINLGVGAPDLRLPACGEPALVR